MKRKLISLMIAATLTATLFVGCGSTEEKSEVTEQKSSTSSETTDSNGLSGKITIATNRTDIVDTVLADYAQAFMDKNPGTEIKYEAIKDYDQVVGTRLAAGEAPDIFYVLPSMNQNTYQDFYMPVDELGFSNDDLYFYDYSKGTDGKIYAFTDTVSYDGIVYNKAAFKKAGINEVPKTMDEFWDACEKLKNVDIVPMGTAFKDVWPIFPWVSFDTVQVAFGGNVTGKNIYLEQDEIFDSTMLESMDIIRELYKKGYLEADIMSANWDQLKLDLAQGKIAMHYSETWYPSQLVEAGAAQEDIGMFPFPGTKNIIAVCGKSWGISKDCQSPALAKAYLTYMLENPVDNGTIPSNKNITVKDPFAAELLSYGVEPINTDIIDSKFVDIRNEIELDEKSFLLKYVLEDDKGAKKAVDEWNKKWAVARAEIMGE